MPELALEASASASNCRRGARSSERRGARGAGSRLRAQSTRRGKKFYASRTWQVFERRGIIEAVERVVKRDAESMQALTMTQRARLHDLSLSAAATSVNGQHMTIVEVLHK